MALTFDGFDLTQYCLVTIERPVAPKLRPVTEQVPGRDGEALLGAEYEPLVITAHMTLRRNYYTQWPSVRDAIAEALCKTSPCRLVLPDEPGRYRMAVAALVSTVNMPFEPPITFDIEFTCHDPIAYGTTTRSETIAAGGSNTYITVGGNMPALPLCVATSAVRDSTTGLWSITADNNKHMRVKPSSSSSLRIEIDCHERVAKVSNALAMLTLDSNWFSFAPGEHSVKIDKGSGAATLSWVERWL